MNTDKIYAEHIANEYTPKETTKVKQLKKLDAKAKRPATILTYTLGIVCALIFGTGMSLAMGVIGSGIGAKVAGIIVGIFGMAGCGIKTVNTVCSAHRFCFVFVREQKGSLFFSIFTVIPALCRTRLRRTCFA